MKIKELFENDTPLKHPGFFTNREDIEQWLTLHGVRDFTILPDGTVNSGSDVILTSLSEFIYVKFGEVTGKFYCGWSPIQSLIGSPKKVNGNFSCPGTKITSLEGSPRWIGAHFVCASNKHLKTLKGGPKHVGGYVDITGCNTLESLDYAPLYVGDDFVAPTESEFTREDIPFTDLKGKFSCGF